MSPTQESDVFLDHLFRRQAGRIVAWLARQLGPAHLDLAEEMVQEAMLRALQSWPIDGAPRNPEAWLFRAAHNAALDRLRRDRRLEPLEGLQEPEAPSFSSAFEEQLRDDELRMIFMCCHPDIPREASVALSLKIAGGFGVREIARGFLAEDTAIAQRIVRAKRQIRECGLTLELPGEAELDRRLDAVLNVVYLMFNEGYATHEGEELIRRDLCYEALRLARLIGSSSLAVPRVDALVSLMAFQASRLPARVDEAGDLVLLEDQDRGQWDAGLISLGFRYLASSAEGDEVSTYHVQAAIAAEYTKESPRWPFILEQYNRLIEIDPSPIVALNRAVAIAKVRDPQAALEAIESLDSALGQYYLLPALRGHLLLKLGKVKEAALSFEDALRCRCSQPERRFLERKLSECFAAPVKPVKGLLHQNSPMPAASGTSL